jgi:hypothetical protein
MIRFACLLALASAAPAAADELCAAAAKGAAPAVVTAVTCDEAGLSRYFLLSPALGALTPAQRADVLTNPLRYALAYMSADALNRLQSDFADLATQSVDLDETLVGRGADGQPAPHELFRIVATRADVAGIDWKTLAPLDLFKRVPTQFSPYLASALAGPPAK